MEVRRPNVIHGAPQMQNGMCVAHTGKDAERPASARPCICCACFGASDDGTSSTQAQHRHSGENPPKGVERQDGRTCDLPQELFGETSTLDPIPPDEPTHPTRDPSRQALEPTEVVVQDIQPVPPKARPSEVGAEESNKLDTAVVMHAIPQLKLPTLKLDEAPRPQTPTPLPYFGDSELPFSPPPIATPRGTPNKEALASRQTQDGIPNDCSKVLASDGTWVDSSTIEVIIQTTVHAVSQCILVTHWTSSDLACLISLKSAAGSPGLALEHEGLSLASKSGSEAATIMSARSCAMFRRGLAQALEHTNAKLQVLGVEVRRFQVLREDFTRDNGLLLANGCLHRQAILDRYKHLVDDMFQHEAQYPHKWMQEQQDRGHGHRSPRIVDTISETRPDAGVTSGDHQSSSASTFAARSLDKSTKGIRPGYQQYHAASQSGASTPRPGNAFPHLGSLSREQSPRAYSRENSPRARDRKGHQQKLSKSVRMLSMDGIVGPSTSTPRDRGRYSPTFAAAHSSVRPFNKSTTMTSIIPVGSGPLGLPVGGANFDGLARTCTSNIGGRPPRPQGARTPPGSRQPAYGQQGVASSKAQTNSRSSSPAHAASPSDLPPGYSGNHALVMQNAAGEWAF